jgi:nucleoid-associated protein YgaU
VQDYVGDSVVVELPKLRVLRQFELPSGDCAGAFERKVTFVAEVELEQSAVVLRRARRDRIDADAALPEARIVGEHAAVVLILGAEQLAVDADHVVE